MRDYRELFQKRIFSFLMLAALLTGCATRPVRPANRHGLLEDTEPGSSSAAVSRKTASELYALKPGGDVDLSGKWQWPLKDVEISSPYGERGRKFHQGTDLRAPLGTPVHAAADGEVVYVGSKIRGYGRMVVVKHSGNFYTVYAHHSKNLVKMGEKVEMGQVIAKSGKSGHSSGPHLHFELRRGTQSFDPEYALNGYLKSSVNRKIASQSHVNHDFEE